MSARDACLIGRLIGFYWCQKENTLKEAEGATGTVREVRIANRRLSGALNAVLGWAGALRTDTSPYNLSDW